VQTDLHSADATSWPDEALLTLDALRKNLVFDVMNRRHTVVFRRTASMNDDFVSGTPEERIALV
jgi:hypothetical protein